MKFNKNRFAMGSKTATIWRKEYLFQAMQRAMATACRHPKVRIVSRHDDTEFVECLECGEVFDSEEFRDMEIEDSAEAEDVSGDP
jgi:Zn ribbon nucleic-acid-binding protein